MCSNIRAYEGEAMRLTFLGSDSKDGSCPTLYATDRGTYVVQGYRVTDSDALSDLCDVLEGETAVEIPKRLLRYADTEES